MNYDIHFAYYGGKHQVEELFFLQYSLSELFKTRLTQGNSRWDFALTDCYNNCY